jgi:hypothetical protein
VGEAQLDLFERLLQQLDLYASTVTREELEGCSAYNRWESA